MRLVCGRLMAKTTHARMWHLALLLICLLTAARAAHDVHPDKAQGVACSPDCAQRGTCNPERGQCMCPFGFTGNDCEVDVLRACRMAPDKGAYCGFRAVKSCECYRQWHAFNCRLSTILNQTICEERFMPGDGQTCYEREGVPAEEQFSVPPEADDPKAVYYKGWKPGSPKIERNEAMKLQNLETLPFSECPDACSHHGYCMKYWQDPKATPMCHCHHGFSGGACEHEENLCILGCSGRGRCVDNFCHCDPPYFGLGCTRSKAYPFKLPVANPANFRIYMYELESSHVYPIEPAVGFREWAEPYIAFQLFMKQFLTSPVRTEDPSEASLFYVPAYHLFYAGNTGSGNNHMRLLLEHVQQQWPFWNRTGGRDHFFFTSGDRGGFLLDGPAKQTIKLMHFGKHCPPGPMDMQEDHCSSYHPLRDVVTPAYDARQPLWLEQTRKMTVDELIAGKKRILFFAGTVIETPEYSGGTRQALQKLVGEWNDPEFSFNPGGPAVPYDEAMRTSKFCLAPYGNGFGQRVNNALACGCVPVVVQEHVFQPFEDILPYEDFSLRLNNADLPYLREILRSVSDAQYRRLLANVIKHKESMVWEAEAGGKAFDHTIASLRRRLTNLQAKFF